MKHLLAAAAFAGLSITAAAAHAGANVYWSVGINAPIDPYGTAIGARISNARPYRPAPVYVGPAPVFVPTPVYVQAPLVVVPQPVYIPRGARHGRQPIYVLPQRPHHGHWAPQRAYRHHPYGPISYGRD